MADVHTHGRFRRAASAPYAAGGSRIVLRATRHKAASRCGLLSRTLHPFALARSAFRRGNTLLALVSVQRTGSSHDGVVRLHSEHLVRTNVGGVFDSKLPSRLQKRIRLHSERRATSSRDEASTLRQDWEKSWMGTAACEGLRLSSLLMVVVYARAWHRIRPACRWLKSTWKWRGSNDASGRM